MTPHIHANKEEIAELVLMPGDPLRAEYIAKKYLKDYKLVNSVRNMFFYTGTYKNKKVTVAASGMGVPSMGIYSFELFNFYDVKKIIRIGTCGSYVEDLKLYDTVIIEETVGESDFAKIAAGIDSRRIKANEELIKDLQIEAKELGINSKVANSHSADVFYRADGNPIPFGLENNCAVGEMESYALFSNAIAANKKAATILTVSDELVTGKKSSPLERQQKVDEMVMIALNSIIK